MPSQNTARKGLRWLVLADLGICLAVLLLGMVIGTWNLRNSGPLWYDGPRYTNQGAMIHDWFHSGELTHPYEFAKQNYIQYPAFSSPYHPPAYPLMLAGVFSITGVSWTAARWFISACAGLLGCFVYVICRQLGASRVAGLAAAVLLLTTPEIARWSRDTMSEIPALMAMMLATCIFVLWLNTRRTIWCWLAFGCALFAFFCGVRSIGLLPAWFLFAWWSGRVRQLFSWSLGACVLLYFAIAVPWVKFVSRFAYYEVVCDGKDNLLGSLGPNLYYFWVCVPPVLVCGSLVTALAGTISWLRGGDKSRVALFWLAWLTSYTLFKLATPTNFETRYFMAALPALAGLSVCLVDLQKAAWMRRLVVPAALAVALVVNLAEIAQLPHGIVGYQGVAEQVAQLDDPGNVLLACWDDQDVIFHYRSSSPHQSRQMIRGDRSLAIRAPIYARVDATLQAHSDSDVIDILKQGRVRYLVTCCPETDNIDKRTPEMVLAHEVAANNPSSFQLISEKQLLHEIERPGFRARIYVWKYTGSLPDGDSELPIVIPTANMTFSPRAQQ